MSEQTKRALIAIAVLSALNGLAIGFFGQGAGFISGCLVGLAFFLGERNTK